jgi:reverse gyrase
MRGIYHGLCINCKSAISDERLLKFGICENCLEKIETKKWKQILQSLKNRRKLFSQKSFLLSIKSFTTFPIFLKELLGKECGPSRKYGQRELY